jgi:hypothetical protein
MPVTVTPQTFQYVLFDAELISKIANDLMSAMDIANRAVEIHVDETTPLARIAIDVGDPIVIRADSGAFEDTRKPRQQSEVATATALGRVLLRARDRLTGGFGEAPPDDQLSLAQVAAWETYCVGRLSRLGVATNQQRWRYNYRNRLGFSDLSDIGFDTLWASDGLTWDQLNSIAGIDASV